MPDCRSLAAAAAAAAAKLRRVLDAAEAADPKQLDERPETVIGQVKYCMYICVLCSAGLLLSHVPKNPKNISTIRFIEIMCLRKSLICLFRACRSGGAVVAYRDLLLSSGQTDFDSLEAEWRRATKSSGGGSDLSEALEELWATEDEWGPRLERLDRTKMAERFTAPEPILKAGENAPQIWARWGKEKLYLLFSQFFAPGGPQDSRDSA